MKILMIIIMAATMLFIVACASTQNWRYLPRTDVYFDLDSLEPLYDSSNFVGGLRFWIQNNPPIRFQVDCRKRTLDVIQVGDKLANVEGLDYTRGTKGNEMINFMCEVVAEMNKLK